MKTITPVFPCLIYEDETKDFHLVQDKFIDYAYGQEKKNPKSAEKSNRGGWQSPDPKFFINDPLKFTNDLALLPKINIFIKNKN